MPRKRVVCHTKPLFAAEQMVLTPSKAARLLALARSRPRSATERERRLDEDRETMDRLRRWGADLARRFGLVFLAIDPERDGVVDHYGLCYEDGLILIRLRHARSGRLLKESSLVDTLCHELAHLRHFDHSVRFKRLYLQILQKARDLGYYRPGPQETVEPRQLALFGNNCSRFQRRSTSEKRT